MKAETPDGAVGLDVTPQGVEIRKYFMSGHLMGQKVDLTIEQASALYRLLGVFIENRIGECLDEIARSLPNGGADG